jgi:hypothetical protein
MGKQIEQFLKEEIQIANKYMNQGSASLTIKEMQIKTSLRPSYPSQIGNHQENKQHMLGRMQEKRSPHILLVGMYASATPWKSVGLPYDPAIPLSGI